MRVDIDGLRWAVRHKLTGSILAIFKWRADARRYMGTYEPDYVELTPLSEVEYEVDSEAN